MKKIWLFLGLFCLIFTSSVPAFAATTYYNESKIKCGYYVSDDGLTGVLVEKSKIVVFDLYDLDHSKFYKTSKDALKSQIASVGKEKATLKKGAYDFKTIKFFMDSKGNVKILVKAEGVTDSDALKFHFAGTTYEKAINLAKKKLDAEFS